MGEDQIGLVDVSRALELAEPEGFISIFLEEGQAIADALTTLLKRHMPAGVKPSFIKQILAAFPTSRARSAMSSRPVGQEFALIEPLTTRELEVLKLIAAGDPNQVIADKLVITLSAVKKHSGNIFRKLNASNRTQAVARARILGLLVMED
jgi:LuxR family maltose regulon positive regulatory protein